jgi:hypothetical protein
MLDKFINNPLPYKIESKISKYVTTNNNYGVFNDQDNKLINSLSKEYNIQNIILESMYRSYIRNKIIVNYNNIQKSIKKIIELYKSKMSILKLSELYNNSPLSILRLILYEQYKSKKIVKNILNNPVKYLSNFDYEQCILAIKNDLYCTNNQDDQLKESLKYEKEIQIYLDKNNIKYKTQEQMIGSNLTPDFLLDEIIIINGHKIKWIDAKNYYGAFTPMNMYSLKKQAKKYNKAYGTGAFVFSLGFSEKIKIEHTCLYTYFKKT